MARYTNCFVTGSSQANIKQVLVTVLEACNLSLIYQDPIFIVAKERPGRVSLSQLATVELLINPPTAGNSGSKIDLVVKNEELPLRRQNHCQQLFEQVNQAIFDASSDASSQVNSQAPTPHHIS
ncbi:MAG: hypothetical protein WBD47_01030 [Phormidesmis sp.]